MKSRTFFGLLLAVNAGLAGALAWQIHKPSPTASLPPEEHAAQVRLSGEPVASQTQAIASAVVAAPAAPAAETPPSDRAASAVETAPAGAETDAAPLAAERAQSVSKVCLRWADLTGEQWQSARVQLQKRLGKLTLEERIDEDKAKYWVYVPPRDDLDTARQLMAELKDKGVTDAFIIQDGGPQQFAISLGLFSKKAMADTFLKYLRVKEIRNAVSRPYPQSRYLTVVMQDVPADKVVIVQSLAAGFEKSSVRTAKCQTKD